MVRSLYAGVMGMKAHQARLDVIGNNIANVSTYGFKASRATFKDVYYSTLSGASGATNDRGGKNPTQIGYGSSLNSIDVIHGQQGVQMTDRGLDAAITGEGFFQVKDADGNIFYTRAGILNYDEAGNLIDSNGNFVLGVSGNPLGKAPGKEKIQFNIPAVDPTAAKAKQKINGVNFTVSAQNSVAAGNVKLQIISSGDLPLGEKCSAEINSSSILIKLNKSEKFGSLSDLESAINDAITEANGGVAHPAGKFSISMDDATKFAGGLSGEEIASKDYTPQLGKIEGLDLKANDAGKTSLGIKFVSAGSKFTASGVAGVTPTITKVGDDWQVSIGDYSGKIPKTATSAGELILKKGGTDSTDCFTITHNGYDYLETVSKATGGAITVEAPSPALTATATTPSKALGLSEDFILTGGTEGGPQGVDTLSNIAIGANGVIEGYHGVYGRMELGRIDVVTFENPNGLAQAGNTYFQATANSGEPRQVEPGMNGSGGLQAGALELSAVDLSKEFADMITTQRGFQANSRIITVSDEVLNELVNLKR